MELGRIEMSIFHIHRTQLIGGSERKRGCMLINQASCEENQEMPLDLGCRVISLPGHFRYTRFAPLFLLRSNMKAHPCEYLSIKNDG